MVHHPQHAPWKHWKPTGAGSARTGGRTCTPRGSRAARPVPTAHGPRRATAGREGSQYSVACADPKRASRPATGERRGRRPGPGRVWTGRIDQRRVHDRHLRHADDRRHRAGEGTADAGAQALAGVLRDVGPPGGGPRAPRRAVPPVSRRRAAADSAAGRAAPPAPKTAVLVGDERRGQRHRRADDRQAVHRPGRDQPHSRLQASTPVGRRCVPRRGGRAADRGTGRWRAARRRRHVAALAASSGSTPASPSRAGEPCSGPLSTIRRITTERRHN
ncbi:hypothetical protein SCANM63S_00858 [Streptomyces canarius]